MLDSLLLAKKDNFTENLVVAYGDAQQDGKANFLVELVNVIRRSTYPILITGDFNMTRK
jgi:endonuclease/exonuclease/phosphatase family metal-dependent hydrolase